MPESNIKTTMDKKILFISHDASRTGATIVLLHFLRWLKEHTDMPFSVLVKNKRGGGLLSDFKSLSSVTLYTETLAGRIETIARMTKMSRLLNLWLKLGRRMLGMKFSREDFNLIYANTVTNGEILELLSAARCPIVCHVHELEWGIRYYGMEKFGLTKKHSDRFVAVSQAVKDNLIRNHRIPSNRIDLNYEFIPFRELVSVNIEEAKRKIRREIEIPEKAVVICASGTTGWRKGPDIFVQTALYTKQLLKDVPLCFLWVGGQLNGQEYDNLAYDISRAGLSGLVRFVGEKDNPYDYYAAADIFAMVSREDPFPLVCLEAAALGKPIVCFDDAGGMKEFVEDDAGIVVPYLDAAAMARECTTLIQSVEMRYKMGSCARDKVKDRHDIESAAPKLLEIITKTIHAHQSGKMDGEHK